MGTRRARRIDAVVKARYLTALANHGRLEEAARQAGFTPRAFLKERRRDPEFAEKCKEVAGFAARPKMIQPHPGRLLIKRPDRRKRFDAMRRQIFLEAFAGTCDATAAAKIAGVCVNTVYNARRIDPVFAEQWQAALETGYARLEAELVRQRLAAQALLRETIEPSGEVAAEFERVMKVLVRYDRRNGAVGPRTVAPEHAQRWTFEQAIQALDKKLGSLNIPLVEIVDQQPPLLPPPPEGDDS